MDGWKSVDRKGALANVFSNDIRERPEEYLKVDNKLVGKLSGRYIRDYFYALRELLQNNSVHNQNTIFLNVIVLSS